MLITFWLIFVGDTEIISGYNFVAPNALKFTAKHLLFFSNNQTECFPFETMP